jgi:hypothetical protein
MFRLKRIKFKKIKEIFKELPRILGEKAFLTFLSFLLLTLILGAFIFYQYSILVKKEKPEVTEEYLKFREKTYQTILNEWQKRNEKFLEIDLKEYPDPFKID